MNNVDNSIKSIDIITIVKKHQAFLQANTPFKDKQGSIGLIANGWVNDVFEIEMHPINIINKNLNLKNPRF